MILAAAAVVQIRYLRKADETARIAAEAAKQSAETAGIVAAAYVVPTNIERKPGTGDRVIVDFEFQNIGGSPAILIVSVDRLRYFDNLPSVPDYGTTLHYWQEKILYAGKLEPRKDRPIEPADIAHLGADEQPSVLHLYGFITFQNLFGETWTNGFCFSIDPETRFIQRAGGGAYNYSREEKQEPV
jgi:hypothetical protein